MPTLEDLLKSDRPAWFVYGTKRLVHRNRSGEWVVWEGDKDQRFDTLEEEIAALTDD